MDQIWTNNYENSIPLNFDRKILDYSCLQMTGTKMTKTRTIEFCILKKLSFSISRSTE